MSVGDELMDSKRAILLAVKEGRLPVLEAKEALLRLQRKGELPAVSKADDTAGAPTGNESDRSTRVPDRHGLEGRTPQVRNESRDAGEPLTAAGPAIAVIGLSGRFPDARNVEQFWSNLAAGHSSVGDVPRDRGWDIADYYDPRPQTPGRTYVAQGAFLTDIARFDAKFFGISPREAERMDPSERLFLQEACRAIEDAGYAPTAIGGERWGVFSCAKGDYGTRIQQQDPTFHFSTDSIAASRLSYLLNLVGPAVTVDTACSSTLAAIAYACDSLTLGNCDVAIAGGGGIYTLPNMLVTASQATLFSPTCQTRAFDSRADGIVMGEAICAVVLKPLASAVRDDDPIWGVIRGWGTNQDGRTNGITAPNANAQARLETDIYRRFGIDPAGITLVEAHGTGTRLGDPIEVQALVEAFRGFTQASGYCALSSVKPNIGHAFFGAGIAGLAKVLLCLRHRQIPPSIHFEQLNPHIRLDDTPFVIHKELTPWNVGSGERRRAAVSSFGATGINVHLVLEETGSEEHRSEPAEPSVVLLSARTAEQVRELARELQATVAAELARSVPNPRMTLQNIAYTLQIARQAHQVRLAVVACSLSELETLLGSYLQRQMNAERVYFGASKVIGSGLTRAGALELASPPEWADPGLMSEVALSRCRQVARDWAHGAAVNWTASYPDGPRGSAPRRVHLPGYPFAGDSHWITADVGTLGARGQEEAAGDESEPAHPLLQRRIATSAHPHFVSRFTGEEFFLAAHQVQGKRVLPGVAYLEMARAALDAALEPAARAANCTRVLRQIVWVQPYVFSEDRNELHIELRPVDSSAPVSEAFAFEVYSGDPASGARTLHCQGKAGASVVGEEPRIDLSRVRGEVAGTGLIASECYARFAALGFELGPKLQGLGELSRGRHEVLAKLVLPLAIKEAPDSRERAFTLHPTLLDSALQACIGFSVPVQAGYAFTMDRPALPFVLESMEVLGSCPDSLWVWIRVPPQSSAQDRVQRFDMDLCDETGRVCVRMRGFSSSELRHGLIRSGETPGLVGTLSPARKFALLEPVWVRRPVSLPEQGAAVLERHVLLCEFPRVEPGVLQQKMQNASVRSVRARLVERSDSSARFIEIVTELFTAVKRILEAGAPERPLSIQVIASATADGGLFEGLGGLVRALPLQVPGLAAQLVLLEGASSAEDIAAVINSNGGNTVGLEPVVRYPTHFSSRENPAGVGEQVGWRERVCEGQSAPAPWRRAGIYLITGGLGALGRKLAAEILRQVPDARVILVGRSALDGGRRRLLDELRGHGGQVEYRVLDICDLAATRKTVTDILSRWGALHGVIHCAGVLSNTPLPLKTAGEIVRVMEPKVAGAAHLDVACADIELEMFVLFSSSAAALGYVRQPDYAAASAFLDTFAVHRNRLVAFGQRRGHTLSIAWPFWRDGGIPSSTEHQTLLCHNSGLAPIDWDSGMAALYAALEARASQVSVISGELSLVRQIMGQRWMGMGEGTVRTEVPSRTASRREPAQVAAEVGYEKTQGTSGVIRRKEAESSRSGDEALRAEVRRVLIQAICHVNKLAQEDVEADSELADLGFDSISLTTLSDVLNREFALSLLPTLFFEHSTVGRFTEHLLTEHAQVFRDAWGLAAQEDDTALGAASESLGVETAAACEVVGESGPVTGWDASTLAAADKARRTGFARENEPIAVIGMSGRFPRAGNVTQFWENLAAGRDCISEVPPSRWDWRAIYGDPRVDSDKTSIKWGGFIDGVDEFDPLFFNIPPRDAELLDPQHRLLMTHVWEVVEDAGYAPSSLAGTNTAIYVGTAADMGYGDLVSRALGRDYAPPPVSMAPNRMSYFLDLRGPSEPIETACSSSLVAVHRGVLAIRSGLCDMAIVGGVQTMVTPAKHISFNKSGLLCEDGRCKAFSARANGFVRGEGVGMVMLKRLREAEAAGDNIYGVILGSAENHGGRASSFTAPNPVAQAELLKAAYRQAGIDPATVSYIEAHGTGTELGDPIEINGLKAAFKELLQDSGQPQARGFCGLGSVKTNIGHLEIAAGVAGMIKVLQQMRYGTLAKTLHCQELNPYIQLDGSPFYIVREQQPWKAPRDAAGNPLPRRAGVSSFGIGGANAHVVLEEYSRQRPADAHSPVDDSEPAVVLLSAKSPDRLREAARNLLAFVERHGEAGPKLRDLAYTLQVGRDAMEERLGILVTSRADLERKLRAYLAQPESATGDLAADLRRGHSKRHKEVLRGLEGDDDLSELMERWLTRRKLSKLLDLWVNGLGVDWARLYRDTKAQRVSLPTYPFERDRYWVDAAPQYQTAVSAASTGVAAPHPLLQNNTSVLSEQRFTSTFSGREFFFADHVVNGLKMMPAVAFLEMARAAMARSLDGPTDGDSTLVLRNVVWARPITVTDSECRVHISLRALDDPRQAQFDIYADRADGSEPALHCQGRVEVGERRALPKVRLMERVTAGWHRLDRAAVYELFGSMGIHYGAGHRGVVEIQSSGHTAWGEIRLPDAVRSQWQPYELHPALLDSALQVSVALGLRLQAEATVEGGGLAPVLPFALERLEQSAPCQERMWVRVAFSDSEGDATKRSSAKGLSKVDVDLCDEEGNVCVRLSGLTSRVLLREMAESGPETSGSALVMAESVWSRKPGHADSVEPRFKQRWVLLVDRTDAEAREVGRQWPDWECRSIRSSQHDPERFTDLLIQTVAILKEVLGSAGSRPAGQGQTLVQLVVPCDERDTQLMALAGLLRTMSLENPHYRGQLIGMPAGDDPRALGARLAQDARRPQDDQVRYTHSERQRREWRELTVPAGTVLPWKSGGTYVITGGMGGLGRLLAAEIVSRAEGCHVVLMGRSAPEGVAAALQDLRAAAIRGTIEYQQADVCDVGRLRELIAEVGTRRGSIQGVVHTAGVLRDSFLIKKTATEVREALAPKVAGTLSLDEATRDWDLDFLVLFSSAAAPFGNLGQADYSAANAFMDEFARHRNTLVAAGTRSGHTLSIGWPLWAQGGMTIDATTAAQARERFGVAPMATRVGLQVLYFGLEARATHLLALSGEPERLRGLLEPGAAHSRQAPADIEQYAVEGRSLERPAANGPRSGEDLDEKARAYFVRLLSAMLKIPVQKIRADEPFETYGIDSIVVMELTNRLEKDFGSLSKTLFFEHQTLAELARHFVRAHGPRLRELTGAAATELGKPLRAVTLADSEVRPITPPRGVDLRRGRKEAGSRESGVRTPPAMQSASGREQATGSDRDVREAGGGALEIAIVGLSGRYPESIDLEAYWDNLRAGRHCITEVPESRWDWRALYDPQFQRAGAHFSKWGGFIAGMDEFDPLFFNISPREAEYMDPQERLFLMHAWMAIEDAGYTRASLKPAVTASGELPQGSAVGVYAGVMYNEYQLYGAEQTLLGNPLSLSGSAATVANRVSYIMGFHGPSLTVDTMCSASLTAIHLACQDLKTGRTGLAVAGGVNVTLHSNKYSMLSGGQFISTEGRCESFGAGGDGYIPGEGVGVVVLKRLVEAIRAGDHIYAVIKGSAINHGGKTNGYSVPNPVAQRAVIAEALREAQLEPRAVSYVEAHGTGTKLGDPIEITGLTQAFAAAAAPESRDPEAVCWIGSVKSNIGHGESAAGIAGLTKVLLQMKHRQIVPSLHAEVLNPHIDFAATPFRVCRELREWRPSAGYPRIAGVSSFGAGGSNAHLLVQEYAAGMPWTRETEAGVSPAGMEDDARGADSIAKDAAEPCIVPLSARTPEQLRESASRLLSFCEGAGAAGRVSLRDLSYTLQVGREAMQERLALIVHTVADLCDKLRTYLADPGSAEDVFQGRLAEDGATLGALAEDADLRETVRVWVDKKKYQPLAQWWANGSRLDWSSLYGDTRPSRVSLPTYPFARERYWIPNERSATPPRHELDAGAREAARTALEAQFHPLLHRNTSELARFRFSATLAGDEFFLADHVVGGRRTLPAVAYLEMVRAGLQRACGLEACRCLPMVFEHVAWEQPLTVESSRDVHLVMRAQEPSQPDEQWVQFEVYTLGEDGVAECVHAYGSVGLAKPAAASAVDVPQLRARMSGARVSGANCYTRFESAGLHYGPRHRGLVELQLGEGELLASLQLPPAIQPDIEQYVLHPGLLDAALQACVGFSFVQDSGMRADESLVWVPYAVERVEVHGASETMMLAWVHQSDAAITDTDSAQGKLDIDLYNRQGKLCVRMVGLTSRAMKSDASAIEAGVVLATPRWVSVPIQELAGRLEEVAEHWILLCGMAQGMAGTLQRELPGSYCREFHSKQATASGLYGDYARQVFAQVKEIASRALSAPSAAGKVFVQLVMTEAVHHDLLHGLSGLLRSSELETMRLAGQTIDVGREREPVELAALLLANAWRGREGQIRYDGGNRLILSWEELFVAGAEAVPPWRANGVYLITGGLGGLGRLLARDIVEKTRGTTIVLTGRSPLTETSRATLESLSALARTRGHEVAYLQADLGSAAGAVGLVETIVRDYGAPRGILHCAGVNQGNLIIRKSASEFDDVLAAKVTGTDSLDRATEHLELDFFVLFSSNTSVTGGVGQADYAAANGFMDRFAHERHERVRLGLRSGRSLVINWPLWAQGGMRADADTVDLMKRMLGWVPISTGAAIQGLYAALASGHAQVLIQAGEVGRIRASLFGPDIGTTRLGSLSDAEIDEMSEEEIDKALRLLSAERASDDESLGAGAALMTGELT